MVRLSEGDREVRIPAAAILKAARAAGWSGGTPDGPPYVSRFCPSNAMIDKRPHLCERPIGHEGQHTCHLHEVSWP